MDRFSGGPVPAEVRASVISDKQTIQSVRTPYSEARVVGGAQAGLNLFHEVST